MGGCGRWRRAPCLEQDGYTQGHGAEWGLLQEVAIPLCHQVSCCDCVLFITCPNPVVTETCTCSIMAPMWTVPAAPLWDRALGFLPPGCSNGPFSLWGHLPVRGVGSVWGHFSCLRNWGSTDVLWAGGRSTDFLTKWDRRPNHDGPRGQCALSRSSALIALVTPMGGVQGSLL